MIDSACPWKKPAPGQTPAPELPVQEPLLADKPEHLFERPDSELIAPDNPWGFKLDVPTYKHNRGELYNLGIARGALTTEERYVINNHLLQTIRMLDHLPFPKRLGEHRGDRRRAPEWMAAATRNA